MYEVRVWIVECKHLVGMSNFLSWLPALGGTLVGSFGGALGERYR